MFHHQAPARADCVCAVRSCSVPRSCSSRLPTVLLFVNVALLPACLSPDNRGVSRAKLELPQFEPEDCWKDDAPDGEAALVRTSTPASAARDSYCMHLLHARCAPNGAHTVYGSARTQPGTAYDASRNGQGTPLLYQAYDEVFAFANKLGQDSQLSLQSGGGNVGAMRASSLGMRAGLDGHTERASSPDVHVLGIAADILKINEKKINAELFSSFGEEDERHICAYSASSFGLRQTGIATHWPYSFTVTMGGNGTDYEVFEVLARIALGELPQATGDVRGTFVHFMTPAGHVGSAYAFWETLFDEIESFPHVDTSHGVSINELSSDGKRSDYALRWGERSLPLVFTKGVEASAVAVLQHQASLGASQWSDYRARALRAIQNAAQLEGEGCGVRLADGQRALARSEVQQGSFGPRAHPDEVYRDVHCARQALLKALPDGKRAAVDAAWSTGRWNPQAILVLGTHYPLRDPRHQKLAEVLDHLLQGLVGDGDAACNGASDSNPWRDAPILTPGGGGFLSVAHQAAAKANRGHVTFYLDHGRAEGITDPENGNPLNGASSQVATELHAYTFTSLGSLEEELVEHARMVIALPGSLRTAWQLRHALMKLREFRKNLARDLPFVILGTHASIDQDEDWQYFAKRIRFLESIQTAGPRKGGSSLLQAITYAGIDTLLGQNPQEKAQTLLGQLLQTEPASEATSRR